MTALLTLAASFAVIIAVGGAMVAVYDWAVARRAPDGSGAGGPQTVRRPRRSRTPAPAAPAAGGVVLGSARPGAGRRAGGTTAGPGLHARSNARTTVTVREVRRRAG